MYRVTIQILRSPARSWRVVATGTWTPGQTPELVAEGILPIQPGAVTALFDFTPSDADQSGRREAQDGDTLYAMVYRTLPRWRR